MLVKTEAIVLNKIKYSDNSFIVNLYSESEGKISILTRISQRKHDGKANIFLPLNIVLTEFKVKETRSVQTVSFFELVKSPTALNNDISKICISQFIAEVILKMVKEEEQNLQLYAFFKETVEAIENTNINVANVHLIFLKDFARLLGFEICNNYCAETPYFNTREGMFLPLFTTDYESMDQNVSRDFSQLLTMSYGSNNIKLPYQSRKKIIEMLLEYYKYHTENFSEIKSLRVLNDVFDQS